MQTKLPAPPLSDADWPQEIVELQTGFAGQLNVYRTMANHPALLSAWANLREHVVKSSSLTPQQSEVAILRTGFRLKSDYEWAHHVVRARKTGMTDARIASIRGSVDKMSREDGAISGTVDELLSRAEISAPDQKKAAEYVGTKGVFDIMATVGFYSTLAYIANSFHVPLDEDVKHDLATRPFED